MISSTNFDQQATRFGFRLHRVMIWTLALQTLWATWLSVKLVLVDLPANKQLDINFLINDLILVLFAGLTSGGLAVGFARVHDQRTELFHSFIGLTVVIANAWLWQFLNSQNPGTMILPLIESLIN